MNFASDNCAGMSPQILRALEQANSGYARSYGDDETTARLTAKINQIFETDCATFPVATGTAANVLALSLVCPPFGAIYCHRNAHILVDECNAPEFFTGGAKLVGLDGAHGKIDASGLDRALAQGGAGVQHHAQPAAVSISQLSESGVAYSLEEIAALAKVCRKHNVALHMDGARFANAMVTLDCSPAAMTWRTGVDVLSFGATKNGAMAAEAVILFKRNNAHEMPYRRKRGGHLFSKMRFLSAQLEAYLSDDLWLKNARHANGQAARLARGLGAITGLEIDGPIDGNEVFCLMPPAVMDALWQKGFVFHRWDTDAGQPRIRLVTAFATSPEDVDHFIAAVRAACR